MKLSTQKWNIQSLAIKLLKAKGNLSNNVMYNIFQTEKINHNLRSQTDFARICEKTNKFVEILCF